MGVARTFSYTQAWVSKEGQGFKNFRKKGVFSVSSGEKQISPLLAPLRKTFGKIHQCPPWKKILPTPMHITSM